MALRILAVLKMTGGVWRLILSKENGLFHAVKMKIATYVKGQGNITLKDALYIIIRAN